MSSTLYVFCKNGREQNFGKIPIENGKMKCYYTDLE